MADEARIEIVIDPDGGEYRVRIQRCRLDQLVAVLESLLATLRRGQLPGSGAELEPKPQDGTLH